MSEQINYTVRLPSKVHHKVKEWLDSTPFFDDWVVTETPSGILVQGYEQSTVGSTPTMLDDFHQFLMGLEVLPVHVECINCSYEPFVCLLTQDGGSYYYPGRIIPA